MNEAIGPVMIMAILGYITVALVRLVSENRLRHKLIDKGLVDEKIKLLFETQPSSQSDSALKWGIVLIAVGMAFLFAFGIYKWVPQTVRGEMTAGVVFLMAGLGMIIYHIIARGQEKKD